MKLNPVFEISLCYCYVKNFKALVARAIIVTSLCEKNNSLHQLSNLELLYKYGFCFDAASRKKIKRVWYDLITMEKKEIFFFGKW